MRLVDFVTKLLETAGVADVDVQVEDPTDKEIISDIEALELKEEDDGDNSILIHLEADES